MTADGIVVLGVGNTLMQDDGVGVKVVHARAILTICRPRFA